MSLVAAGTGVVRLAWGIAHHRRDSVGWVSGRDHGSRARETQVATIMVEALHLTLTRLWYSFTFIYVWDRTGNMSRELGRHLLYQESFFHVMIQTKTQSLIYALWSGSMEVFLNIYTFAVLSLWIPVIAICAFLKLQQRIRGKIAKAYILRICRHMLIK